MVKIEEIGSGSLDALNTLYQELIGARTDPLKLETAFRSIEKDERYIVLGAFDEGELVGSMMGILCQDIVGECRPFMVIENVVVSSRARRQGIGKLLMTALEKIAHERDCYYIMFVSGEKRKEAHIFYEKMGYKEQGVEGYRKHLSSH